MTADIIDLEPEDHDIALACNCGCVRFHLLGDGNIECSNCRELYGSWIPEGE